MYRPETNGVFYLVLFLPLFFFACCGNAQVLGIPRSEAAEFLEKGDLDFIGSAELPENFPKAASSLKPLLRIHQGAPFYAGLLAPTELSTLLFCAALESPSHTVRHEAAMKLIPLALGSDNEAGNILAFLNSAKPKGEASGLLRAACLYRLGRHNEIAKVLSPNQENNWGKALLLFAGWKGSAFITEEEKQKNSAFLFESAHEEILRWAYREGLSAEGLFTQAELAVLSANSNHRNYASFLNRIPGALQDGGIIFFRHPELIANLGRSFQFTTARREEGIRLFRLWDRLLEGEDDSGENAELAAFIKTLDEGSFNAGKFMVLFYSGRIERALGNHKASSQYFRRALEFAPNELQSDSCIWYILMNSLASGYMDAVSAALDTIHLWNDPSYFDDFLDRISFNLTGRRQWNVLLELFHALEKHDTPGLSLSHYAWILGRAAEEGFIQADLAGAERSSEDFFRIAFENEKGGFYYRTMAASKLGAEFIPEAPSGRRQAGSIKAEEDEKEFILGFFKCGAAAFAMPYLRPREAKLSPASLAEIAEAFALSLRWKDSLDLTSRYIRRKDFRPGRRDLNIFYPKPYKELIEKYAEEAGIKPEILFSLIRTESYFMSSIVSRAGATGLSQLMPPTAEEMAVRIVRRGGPDYRRAGGVDMENPEINIHIGSYYLRYLIEQMGNPMSALLAYNGGMGRIRRALAADSRQSGGGLPLDLFLETIDMHETREYGRRILAGAAIYGYLYYGKSMEDAAADIYPFIPKP